MKWHGEQFSCMLKQEVVAWTYCFISVTLLFMHFNASAKHIYLKWLTFMVYIWSVLPFPGNLTFDLGIASTMLYCLDYRNMSFWMEFLNDFLKANLFAITSHWMEEGPSYSRKHLIGWKELVQNESSVFLLLTLKKWFVLSGYLIYMTITFKMLLFLLNVPTFKCC